MRKVRKIKINKKQIEIGTKVEMEHTKSRKVARKIAMDHLRESEDYYKELLKMEKKLKGKKKTKRIYNKKVKGRIKKRESKKNLKLKKKVMDFKSIEKEAKKEMKVVIRRASNKPSVEKIKGEIEKKEEVVYNKEFVNEIPSIQKRYEMYKYFLTRKGLKDNDLIRRISQADEIILKDRIVVNAMFYNAEGHQIGMLKLFGMLPYKIEEAINETKALIEAEPTPKAYIIKQMNDKYTNGQNSRGPLS